MTKQEIVILNSFLIRNNIEDKYREYLIEDLERLAFLAAFSGAFIWSETKEGYGFWSDYSTKWCIFAGNININKKPISVTPKAFSFQL